mmetsp:Transcript_40679/g.62049  ORF Transcript_40679/g.62049 Transcript_40679/m.62049 type:complete len:232 (+) Transcript_40679:629-1324(+)
MGEVLKPEVGFVADYQNHLTSVFNFPMHYAIRRVWQNGESMRQISSLFSEEEQTFKDVDALGLFVDNHDLPRFLNEHKFKQHEFLSALVFSLTARGIPFFYQGSELAYDGGADPWNREAMWPEIYGSSYHRIADCTSKVNRVRKQFKIWDFPYEEKIVSDSFMAYTRGRVLVALTNTHATQVFTVANSPFRNEKVCNIFWADDCVTVGDTGALQVHLIGAEPKVFVPQNMI